MLCFGESVLYKLPSKGPQSNPDGNMGTQWREAVFMGYNRSANTYILGNIHGTTTARSLMRRPMDNRWSHEQLARIRATPWSERVLVDPRVRFSEPAEAKAEPPAPDRHVQPRRFKINKADLERHGYTVGCRQCDHIQRFGSTKSGTQHSDTCRARLLSEVAKSAQGQERLARHEERVDQAMADHIEREVNRQQPESAPASNRRIRISDDQISPDDTPAQGELGGDDVFVENSGSQGGERQMGSERPMSGGSLPAIPRNPTIPATQHSNEPPAEESRARAETQDASMDLDAGTANDNDIDMGFIGSLEPEVDDFVAQMMLQQLGAMGRNYKREARAGYKHLVSEIYSPPRITAELKKQRRGCLLPGFAFDITCEDPDDGQAWDFSRRDKREKARRLLRQQRPYMIIGSPECKAFSTWMALNEAKSADPHRIRLAKTQALTHLHFVASLYHDQIEAGRYFIHEHPKWATSWQEGVMKGIAGMPEVGIAHCDQCQLGAEVRRGRYAGRPILKPTGFMTNAAEVYKVLSVRCSGQNGECSRRQGGRHYPCMGHVAAEAAIYPRAL